MEILYYPDPALTRWNAPLGEWTPEIQAKVEEMWKVMAEADGAGLAAPQVGWNVRLFILAIPDRKTGETAQRVVYNPKIETLGDLVAMPEGCLSFPGMRATIKRWTNVRLVGQTPEGPLDELLGGLAAQAAQHEMDHLDGILYIERMTPADRMMNERAIKELEERARP